MIVEILAAQRQRVDSLPDHLLDAVLDQHWIPAVNETLTEPRQQVHFRVGFLQQQNASVGTHRPAAELRHDLPPPVGTGKLEPILVTLCHSHWPLSFSPKHLLIHMFRRQRAAFG